MKCSCNTERQRLGRRWGSLSDRGRLDPTDRDTAEYWIGNSPSGQEYWRHSSASATFEDSVADVFREASALLIGRHQDYGPYNISNGWPDPLTALIVRMTDKMERIKNLIVSDMTFGESARDSWIDLANYALIGCMVIDRTWPELPAISARNQKTPHTLENTDGPLGYYSGPASTTA